MNRSAARVSAWRAACLLLALVVYPWRGYTAAQGNNPPPSNVVELKVTVAVQAFLDQARQAYGTGKYDQAAALYDQALSKARELKDRKGETEALRGRGNVYSNVNQPQRALDLYQQAVEAAGAIGDQPLNSTPASKRVGAKRRHWRMRQRNCVETGSTAIPTTGLRSF